MKNILLILVLFVMGCTSHKEKNSEADVVKTEEIIVDAIKINSISTYDLDFSDLVALKEVLGDARIVLLGEQSHGDGSTYSAKVRMIKFLHQEMGFEVMAFESGMYDCAKIWQNMQAGQKMKDEVINSMFYMYATSTEVKPLFNYMDKQMGSPKPLLLCGMDSQHTGEKSQQQLVADLKMFLEENESEIQKQESWKIFERKVADIIKMDRNVTTQDKSTFYEVINNLKTELNNNNSNASDFLNNSNFWTQIINSLETQGKIYWGDRDNMDRDRQMAANMSWLLNDSYKDKKVIIWAHNGHIARGLDPVLPMGHFLKEEFKDDLYAIGFTGYNGEYIDFVTDKKVSIAIPSSSSIEQSFKNLGWKYAMVDFRNLPENALVKQTQKGRLINYNEQLLIFPNIFDGLFYIQTTIPTVRE